MAESFESKDCAVLVHIALDGTAQHTDHITEFQELVASAGVRCVKLITGVCRTPDSHFFVGLGKAESIRQAVQDNGVDLVIISQDISPSQERNLERFMQCRVVGRTGLILDIFAQRARSFEGKLQVELAQLRHLSTRLVRGWTHLERQRGGIGLRGPGETQLETDRRLIGERIRRIKQRLQKVEQQRHQGRQARRKADVRTVSLVGYTNAGKSTLFNRLTNAHVGTANQLFATLDPTLRQLSLTASEAIIMVDTVGFISQLPHELIAAFRATLQESCEAALLIHVIDLSDPHHHVYTQQVYQVLSEIGADHIPCIEVFNKIDCISVNPQVQKDDAGNVQAVWVSAKNGTGVELLKEAIVTRVCGEMVHKWICLPPEAGRLRARLFSLGAVMAERSTVQGNLLLEVHISPLNLERLYYQDGLRREWIGSDACEGLLH